MSSKVLTVFGATGNQGGSVVKTILAHPSLSKEFQLRGVTRNTSSDTAKALSSKGVELVTADMNDPASLKKALEGSYAVFAVTNFWESQSREIETQQGKNIADAAVATGVKHAIWSSLPNVTELTGGSLKHVTHFDGKADVETYYESVKGKAGMTTTYFMPGFFTSNMKSSLRAAPDGSGPALAFPWNATETQVALFDAAEDTGKYVAGILATEPSAVDGHHIHGVSEWATPSQIVETLSKEIGTEVKYSQLPDEVFKGFLPASIADEMTENMILIREYSYFGKGTEKEQAEKHDYVLKAVDLKPTSWKEYVEKNAPWKW